MNVLAIDTESNTWNKGSWSDRRHKPVCYSFADEQDSGAERISPESIELLQRRVDKAGTIVGFNIKYDANVCRKLGINLEENRIWCCQVAEFLLSNQQWKYPSLEESLVKHGLGHKEDKVAEYWKRGVQTEDIPWDILGSYATTDAVMTLRLYEHQMGLMSESQRRLCNLMCMDLMILAEMEWNGIKFNEELARTRAGEIKEQIQQITGELSTIYPDVPINFGSGDQLSAFLYGGTITIPDKELVGVFKTGLRAGEPKYKNIERLVELPRLIEPLRGSALKKQGFFATNADTLLKLKANKTTRHILDLIKKQVRLETLLSKTYNGLILKAEEQNWEPEYLHGQFNQVTVTTGRLSSSGPNLQNLDSEANDLFVSRYD
jgi:DNA polymerase I-like protein with 3'-5' exonuclease and polymerase domains